MFGCDGKMGGLGSPGPLAVRIPPESPAAAFYAVFRLFHLSLQNNFFANQNNR
jgi:hypothetical protein